MGKYKLPEKRGDVSISYVDTEKGFQINLQSIEEIFGHISPEFELIKTLELKGSNHVWRVYSNKEALDKYNLLK